MSKSYQVTYKDIRTGGEHKTRTLLGNYDGDERGAGIEYKKLHPHHEVLSIKEEGPVDDREVARVVGDIKAGTDAVREGRMPEPIKPVTPITPAKP